MLLNKIIVLTNSTSHETVRQVRQMGVAEESRNTLQDFVLHLTWFAFLDFSNVYANLWRIYGSLDPMENFKESL